MSSFGSLSTSFGGQLFYAARRKCRHIPRQVHNTRCAIYQNISAHILFSYIRKAPSSLRRHYSNNDFTPCSVTSSCSHLPLLNNNQVPRRNGPLPARRDRHLDSSQAAVQILNHCRSPNNAVLYQTSKGIRLIYRTADDTSSITRSCRPKR
ncbi:uncharacterized protein BT62DRAFT_482143 [Guyanagaster necrorhizus]|uniref:Uncharacterized protein n=1 Tax=Guyanagaster necrorhizus TaxID=856835 RepID=A0A9P8AMR2_9AGAR|nr:uncharacterized protein BT62DRAFT_482143 [Guyanagaster necrorhizus MCA 3950]KAG7441513.1 hypothetical protein BT62DRAFT_482143 [Guyanagaster necrorhizus MCA 3950]